MKQSTAIIFMLWVMLYGTVHANPILPIKAGEYIFQHRDAEFPDSQGFPVNVTIRGYTITVINPKPYGPIPAGVIDEATLMWHRRTNQWILGHDQADDIDQLGLAGHFNPVRMVEQRNQHASDRQGVFKRIQVL